MKLSKLLLKAIMLHSWRIARNKALNLGGLPRHYLGYAMQKCWSKFVDKSPKQQEVKASDLRSAKYEKFIGQNVIGGEMSEKLHGIWAKWNGKDFYTRNGLLLSAPESFKKGLPNQVLTGELWLGYGQFQTLCGIVRSAHGDWSKISFNLFNSCSAKLPQHVKVIPQIKIESDQHRANYLAEIMAKGGEGLCLKIGDVILKDKPKQSVEAVCVAVTAGTKANAGKIGALICELNGVQFKVGIGLSLKDRAKSAIDFIGKQITVEFMNLTLAGKPYQPVFVGERFDL